jgi:hypothetical protein
MRTTEPYLYVDLPDKEAIAHDIVISLVEMGRSRDLGTWEPRERMEVNPVDHQTIVYTSARNMVSSRNKVSVSEVILGTRAEQVRLDEVQG